MSGMFLGTISIVTFQLLCMIKYWHKKKHYPQAKVVCLKGYSHGELVLRHPEQYIKLLEQFLGGNSKCT